MSPLPRSIRVAALTALAALLLAAPAGAVKPRKVRALGPVEVIEPFKGAAAKPRPLATAAATLGHGGFVGLLEPACCHVPPEVGGAVGGTQVVQTDATSVTVFDRNGGQQKQTSLDNFCETGSEEPRVHYDHELKRWTIAALIQDGFKAVCIATSTTSSATGFYHQAVYPVETSGDKSRNLRLGMDSDALYLAYDRHSGPGVYDSTDLLALSKTYLAGGRWPTTNRYRNLPPLTPPIVADDDRPSSYFLSTGPDSTHVQLWAGTALHRNGSLTKAMDVEVPAYASAAIADQPGTADDIRVEDARFRQSSHQVGRSLLNVHTVSRNGRPTTRWYRIDLVTGFLEFSGRLAESSASDDFSPSLAASRLGHVFFTWTATDARNPTVSRRHGPRMRFATWKSADASPNKSGVPAATGGVYTPTPGSDSAWGRGQVTLAPAGYNRCDPGTFAFAVGPYAPMTNRWQGYVKKFGTC